MNNTLNATLLLGAALLLAGPSAQSSLLLDEPFNYPDGPLTVVSAGRWSTHGGTSNQIQAVSSRVVLTQSDTEDVSSLLTGGPFRGPVLYAGWAVNFTALPTGAGAYFAHFKDSTATGFRGRVYAATNSAAPGRFRIGVANGAGAPNFIPADLERGTRYYLVLRYDSSTAESTLWLNPTGENSTRDRADAADATTALGILSFGLRQAVGGGSGMGTLTLDSLKAGTSFVEVVEAYDPRLAPPALSHLPDQSIPANTSTPAVPFVVQDGETAADDLLLTAVSDYPGLVATSGVVFGGGGSNRTVRVTPTPGRQGVARVLVTVRDADGNTASGTFQVTVGVPSLSLIPDQITPQNTPTQPIPFTVGDAEGDALVVRVLSTNETLLPVERIQVQGLGPNRTIILDPAPGATGLSRVILSVSDGFSMVSNSFLLTVFPNRGVILADDFTYADGSVVTNSQLTWRTYGASTGDTGQTAVVQGRLVLRSSQTEDIQSGLTEAPYAPEGTWMLYARFVVTFIARPTGSADYFAHFRGVNSGSGCRVFATSSGAAPGKFRLGLANADSSPSAVLPGSLDTNAAYTVVVRFNTATGQSALWVNPTNEASPVLLATDEPTPFDVWNYALRQSGGIGSLTLDDLHVGTAFSDVVSSTYPLRIRSIGGGQIELAWPVAAEAAHLQASDTAPGGNWVELGDVAELIGAEWVVRLASNTGQRFFRLATR